MLCFIINVFKTAQHEPDAGNNPWDAPTLEWATTSPPPEHDFDVIPEVHSREPLWYNRDHNLTIPEPEPGLHIHMPPPSYYPIIVAFGLLLLGLGPLSHLALTALGVPVIIYGVWGWVLEPTE